MSGPPYELQRLPAILNFSGGRSSAFMLYHLLEHYDGRLHAKLLWSQATLWQRPWQLFLVIKREKPPHDNQRGGFPPLADVLDSERPIDRLPPGNPARPPAAID